MFCHNLGYYVIIFIVGVISVGGEVNNLTGGTGVGKPLDQLIIYACGQCDS